MTDKDNHGESQMPSLILFVTGNAPRSVRARANLAAALDELGCDHVEPMEVDLMREPDKTVSYSVFATPALMRSYEDGQMNVLYGDLSEEDKLLAFLKALDK